MISSLLHTPAPAGAISGRAALVGPRTHLGVTRRSRIRVHDLQLSLDRWISFPSFNLAFDTRGGPLLAVVGLCGGAGTTTIAYLTGTAAAIESTAPVLLGDLGGPAAGIAACANAQGGPSFTTLATYLARGQPPPGPPFTAGEYGVRLLAAPPQLDDPFDEDGASELLAQAAAAHGLTVLDCAQLTRPVERLTLAHATHVAWVLPASQSALRRGSTLLTVLGTAARGREIVIARHHGTAGDPVLDGLTQLAEDRAAPLVLVDQLDDVAETGTERVLEQAALALQALGGVLHR